MCQNIHSDKTLSYGFALLAIKGSMFIYETC